MQSFDQILNDPVKAQEALDQHARDNCDGRFRKKVIDWGQWKRQFGIKISTAVRDCEDWMDVTEYTNMKCQNMPDGPARTEA
eukprot:5324720-Pyramimonas_sp.AAC.1